MLNKQTYILSFAFIFFLTSCQMINEREDERPREIVIIFDCTNWEAYDTKIGKLQSGAFIYKANLDHTPPFSSCINKVVTFQSPQAINISHHCEGLTFYSLVDCIPLGKETIDLLNVPVDNKARTVGFRGIVIGYHDGNTNSVEKFASIKIMALIKVRSKFLNDGKAFYIMYDWYDGIEGTETIGQTVYVPLKRAPWEPKRINIRRVQFDFRNVHVGAGQSKSAEQARDEAPS